ncbi:hypothetical protein J4206_03025 [Candidatus Woesearchaeota archaeon]|nr:hypothetical protein [Candidatus Woesearchaeota archaeon]
MKRKNNLTILIGAVIVLAILFILSIYSKNYSDDLSYGQALLKDDARSDQSDNVQLPGVSQPPELSAEDIKQKPFPGLESSANPNSETLASDSSNPVTAPSSDSSTLPPGRCKSGYTDTYRCSGNKILRETIDSYCKQAWQAWKTCDYGCANSTCIEPDGITLCSSGFTDKYQCESQESQREYKNKACKTSWLKDQLCLYGCNQATGRCNSAP